MYLKFKFPTMKEVVEINNLVERYQKKLIASGLPSKSDMIFYLRKFEIFTNTMEMELTNLQERDEVKYPKLGDFTDKDAENKFLEKCMLEIIAGEKIISTKEMIEGMFERGDATRIQELNRSKNFFSKMTYEGVCDNIRTLKLMQICVSRIDNTMVWNSFNEILGETNKNAILIVGNSLAEFLGGFNQTVLRKIARNSMWRTKWISATKTSAPLFNDQVAGWDTNKVMLAYFSNFYDSVFSGYEVPEEFIIENDKFLDGWLEQKSRESKSKSNISGDADGTRAIFNNTVINKGNLKR